MIPINEPSLQAKQYMIENNNKSKSKVDRLSAQLQYKLVQQILNLF